MAKQKSPSRRRKQAAESTPRRPLPVLEADPNLGLTQAQVQARRSCGWSNDPGESPSKSEGQIIRENTLTFFNLIFLILAVLLVIAGSYKNMMFLVIAIANTAIGTIQEIRSKRAVDKLTLVAEHPAKVIREGRRMDGSVVFEKIQSSGKVGYGYNAYSEEFVEMIAAGIVDPTKVTRSALENAASIGACVLTTESLVVDKPDPAADAAANAAAAAQGGMY